MNSVNTKQCINFNLKIISDFLKFITLLHENNELTLIVLQEEYVSKSIHITEVLSAQ